MGRMIQFAIVRSGSGFNFLARIRIYIKLIQMRITAIFGVNFKEPDPETQQKSKKSSAPATLS